MIVPPILHISFFYLSFVLYFLCNKVNLFLLTSCLSSSQLYSLLQTTLLFLTLTFVILFLLLEHGTDEVHVEELLLPLGSVTAEIFIMCPGLAEMRGDTVQDDID